MSPLPKRIEMIYMGFKKLWPVYITGAVVMYLMHAL